MLPGHKKLILQIAGEGRAKHCERPRVTGRKTATRARGAFNTSSRAGKKTGEHYGIVEQPGIACQ